MIPGTNETYTVRGTVTDVQNRSIPGLLVSVFDRDLRSEQLLGENITDANGQYRVAYSPETFSRSEKLSADLAVKVYGRDGKTILYEPDFDHIVFNAPPDAIVNITIVSEIKPLENEFDTILRTIQPLLETLPLTELQEGTVTRDISFLNKETGIDSIKIEHLVVAHRLLQLSKIDAAFFYGLLRRNTLLQQDIMQPLHTLSFININTEVKPVLYAAALTDAKKITTDIRLAIREMIIPARVERDLPEILRMLSALKEEAQQYENEGKRQRIIGLVTNFLYTDKLGEINRLFEANKTDYSKFLDAVAAADFFKSPQDERLGRISVALGDVLGFQESLIEKVKYDQKIERPEDVKRLARMNRSEWKKILTESGDEINGKKVDKNLIEFQASSLVRKMESKYPSVAFAAQLEREKVEKLTQHKSIIRLFREHEDFDLQKTNIDKFFKEKNLTAETDAPVKRELKSVQRVFNLVPNYRKSNALIAAKITSAQSIVDTGRSRFVNEVAPKAGISKPEAKKIFEKASNIHTASMLIVGELQDTVHAMDIAALKLAPLAAKIEAVSKDFPNLKSLFQGIDLCACEHCRSVYSPAAYLVEILQFLDKRTVIDLTTTPDTPGHLAKDVLFKRRPDLGEIDLGCENAETPLPYIDLVCELLEEAIAPDPGIAYNGALVNGVIPNALQTLLVANNIPVTDKALVYEPLNPVVNPSYYLRDEKVVCKIDPTGPNQWLVKLLHQTHSSAEELAAAPEYVNMSAYNTLNTKAYAFKLPFDLVHTEAKAYFDRFDISRGSLMEDFAIAGIPSPESIAAEKLGLTDGERKLIVTADAANQELYWNTTAPNVVNYMKVVDHFLVKTGLTYKALNNLLSLNFINPTGTLFIQHLNSTCDTAQKEIENLDNAALDRIHRFLRLVKITGLKQEIADEIISQPNLGNGNLDNDLLIIMSQLLALSKATGIKLEELIGFYGEIPHAVLPDAVVKPLYQSVFLNKATTGFLDETLLPGMVDGSTTLADHQVSLAACLQLSDLDFTTLTATFANTDLTFENLSHLYAVVRLCKKLKLSIDDYLLLEQLTGLNVFSVPVVTQDFVEHVSLARTSPLKLTDVAFMLRHEATNLAEREITDERLTQFLQSIQAAFQKSFEGNRSPFDDALNADELSEPLKLLLSKLPGFTEEIVNNFLKMADKLWASPPDPVAATYIDDQLTPFFDNTIRTNIKNLQATLAAAPPANVEAARKDFIEALLAALSDLFYKTDKATFLATALSTSFKTDEDIVTTVLENAILKQPAPGTARVNDLLSSDILIDTTNQPPAPPAITPAAFPQQYDALRLLHKLFALVKALQFDTGSTAWFLQNSKGLGWMELDAIPYKAAQTTIGYPHWEAFMKTLQLLKKFTPVPNPADAENPVTFFSVMELILPGYTTTNVEWLDAYTLLTGYDRTMADDIDVYFGFSNPDPDAYRDPDTWLTFDASINYLRRLGVNVAMVKEFIKPVLLLTDAANLRMALKARYDEVLWLDTLKEIMDKIRPKKRNALVAYMLAENPDLTDENDLFDYYLVDTQMEACMPSSRIVQAHGTIQLFVQRCLMGLEPTAAADLTSDSGWDQWKWMKNYRVWEANRKVFLYPENWIEPELLDDKSYLFSELEEQLLQDEVNEFTTEDALIRYLEKLDDIAFLEVVAQYYQADIYTMHVFARTKGGDPPTYYYRRLEQERYWSPWEKVDLDITSEQLLAFVHNNRLCLAWPLFSEVPNPTHQVTIPGVSANESAPKDQKKVERKLKIQMAISEFANKQWKPKKVSRDGILTPNNYTIDALPQDIYNLMYFEFAEQIIVFHSQKSDSDQEYHYLDGLFDITGCKGYPELVDVNPGYFPDFFPDFKDSWLTHQRYLELGYDATNNLAERNAIFFFSFFEILQQTPGKYFRLTYPHQFTWIDMLAFLYEIIIMKALAGISDFRGSRFKIPLGTLLPYFFEDSEHNYVIVSGFYREDKDPQTGKPMLVRRTFTDALKLLEDIVALYHKYTLIIQQNPNIDPNVLLQQLIADPDFQDILNEIKVYQQLRYGEHFRNMYHPLLCFLRKTLYKDGIAALMKRETQLKVTSFNFNNTYQPNPNIVPQPYPIEDLDFSSEGSYSGYNWELFFHAPLMIATRLGQNQRFEEALAWFHYMFNPTGALDGTVPQKYWVTKPFYLALTADYIAQRIDTLMNKIADPSTPEIKELEFAIDQWRRKPFMPHVVARFRPVAYQKALLMKYLNNLVEWGDYLFRQDTMESVTQATQMYILADKLLGPKPRIIPPVVKVPYETYNQLEAKLDAFGNALIDFENLLPDISVLPHGGAELPPAPITISSLYFCIPRNDKMLEYWDTIADRLFKIRHCRNIDGVERTLALFAPPIDPGMLVRAAAAGLDISSVLAGLNAPLPNYRFNIMAQKATELIQEVRGLGNSLLQALEKKDAEVLALLRNELEMKLLKAMLDMKKIQVKEAEQQIEVLERTKAITEERDNYFTIIEKIIPGEQLNLDKLSESHDFQMAAQIVQATGAILGLIPDFKLGAHGFGGSPAVDASFGGTFLANAASAATSVLNILASAACYEANRASILAGFERRFSDWKLQERLAKLELKQIDQQIVAAQIRVEISEADVKNQELQIENAKKTDDFMRSKFTNKDLYQWMIGQISAVYFKAYKLAYDVSKKAERCYQHELGSTDTFLKYGYWDSLKKGLQTADQLFYDLKKMEASYLDNNKREYEITKHVSLSVLDPLALVRLRATGATDFEIPEAVFDMDHPGHYFRRIKTVSITLPCIAGPYTSVSCRLSLVSNKYRKNTAKAQGAGTPKEEYEEVTGNDDRFVYNVGSIQSVATSNAQNDSGLFELNFRDERYLPFEGTGAISKWRLELPGDVRLFDYNTISDVIVHMKYTAREGGSTLRTLAGTTLKDKLNEIKQQLNDTALHLPLNLKYDMPNEWFVLKKDGTVNLQVMKTRLPYFAQVLTSEIDKITFIGKVKNNPPSFTITINAADLQLNRKDEWSLCLNNNTSIEFDTPFTLAVTPAQSGNLEELMMMVKYVFT